MEILLAAVIIVALGFIVYFAINPARQLAQAHNAQRQSDVNAILDGIYQYVADNRGSLPSSITTSTTEICRTGAVATTTCADLSVLTDNELYLVGIPLDPSVFSTNGTGYYISKNTSTNPRVTVTAPNVEIGELIRATR